MPHLVVEYSDNLEGAVDMAALLSDLHGAIDGLYNVSADRIKARAIPLHHYIVGTHGADAAMIHVTFKLMQGRTVEARKELSSLLQQVVRRYVPETKFPHSAVTIEVVELDTATYCA